MPEIINAFPGYECVVEIDKETNKQVVHNMYRGEDLGLGGYIRSWAGIYYDVALLDIQSLHPVSAISMNYFGEYTQHFKDILDARLLIKHKDFEGAKKLLNGRLAKYLDDPSTAKNLAQALRRGVDGR